MKYPLLTLTLATLTLAACGGDDNQSEDVTPPPPPPPVENTVAIDEAAQINLTLEQFDPNTGTLVFALTDAEKNAITAAKDYDIYYFGFPDKNKTSTNPKAWKRWHVTQNYRCHSLQECGGKLTEVSEGQYQFEIAALDWQQQDPSGSVAQVKVAIQIYGAKASNDLDLIQVLPQ
ncbi:hypothetical protein [Shewanella sp. CG12_big_fil_rev_8_21_14_0_65_47_15]|uniref:hypothetical protein n=1 Tax=Shewanella sp. CG12_big_fil_rev_8_21_14_0_65_47_15 TaxID=1975537 RepID=UPI000CA696B1|nr:hypothetical protein [Shewanella sp. CG12_big_fil_rev_8_21_14_0_65_47_15]PIW61767.1 MAG: hypothetical protein COW15_06170 [Shewanella sp. CG12_big_fil_rev_8_21_14_0_65_47_15]